MRLRVLPMQRKNVKSRVELDASHPEQRRPYGGLLERLRRVLPLRALQVLRLARHRVKTMKWPKIVSSKTAWRDVTLVRRCLSTHVKIRFGLRRTMALRDFLFQKFSRDRAQLFRMHADISKQAPLFLLPAILPQKVV
jgi:hypothetical protein